MKNQHHILVVDDSIDHRKILKQTLVEEDLTVDMAKNSQEALDFLNVSKYDVILLDLVLPDMSGLDLLENIQQEYPFLPVIIMSAFGNEKDAVSSIKKGASDFITKSVGFELRVADTVKNTIKNLNLKKQIDEAQERYEQIYHAANDFMFTLDLNGNFTSFNQKCLNVFPCTGKKKMIGKSFKKVLTKDMHERAMKSFQTILFERTTVSLQDIYVLDEKGEKVYLEINSSLLREKGKVIGVLCVARDVTSVRDMQSREQEYQMRMIETKKLASLGNLVQGIAHNLNTPLGTIMGRAELLQMQHPDLKELDIVLEQAEVMNEIISNLAQKAKRENITEKALWDVNTIIRDEMKFFQADNTYKHKIKKVTKLEADLPKINIVYTHFTQAFESFIQNAIDAMVDSEKKILEIRTSIKDKHIFIDICDTGIGIPKENINHLFDPFFTTKSPISDKTDKQTGLGLGLYNAYLLLQPYGIEFSVKSIKKSTCFTWKIPVESAKK